MIGAVPAPAQSTQPAEWIKARYRWDASWTDNGVGDGFESYVRVFHPFGEDGVAETWAEVAAEHGKTMHAAAWWDEITTDGPWNPSAIADPHENGRLFLEGNLPQPVLSRVCDVLRRHTATPDRCYFGVWNGWGWDTESSLTFTFTPTVDEAAPPLLEATPVRLDPYAPRFDVPHRGFLLYQGAVEQALQIGGGDYREGLGFLWKQSPTLMWPADHAWCLATEIDSEYTMIGGSAALAADLLDAVGVECLAIDPDAPLFDSVNQVRTGGP